MVARSHASLLYFEFLNLSVGEVCSYVHMGFSVSAFAHVTIFDWIGHARLLDINIDPWTAATCALVLFTSAYLAEVWRGAVESVSRGNGRQAMR